MNYYTPEEIQRAFVAAGMSVGRTDIQAKAEQYHQAVIKEIAYGFYMQATVPQILANRVPFNISRVRKQLGRYGDRKGQQYWWDWLHANFPLITVIKKGNSIQKMNSIVESKLELDILLASNNNNYVISEVYRDLNDDTKVHYAKIDQRNLKNYIAATTAGNHTNKTVTENLKMARLIQMIAEATDGVLPQIVNVSNFGRTYYRGPNLQSVSKTVRHAALGPCFAVDVNSSVFNWKYSCVPFQKQLIRTRELIQDKTRVRKQLANLLFGNSEEWTIKTVKQIITAIGFGARGNTGPGRWQDASGVWQDSAIKKIIRSEAVRQRFFSDPWVKAFLAEQKLMDDHIFAEMREGVKEAGLNPVELGITTDSGRISRSKTIAFGYQQSEASVMRKILEHSNAEQLLQVHDAYYFKTKPDVASMGWILQKEWPLATLSFEKIEPWGYENLEYLQQHRDRIAAEETAAGGVVNSATVYESVKQNNPHVEQDYNSWVADQERVLSEHMRAGEPTKTIPAHILKNLNREN